MLSQGTPETMSKWYKTLSLFDACMFSNGSNGKISENMIEIPLPPYEGKYFKDFVGPHQGKNNFQCIFASFELIQK